MPLSTKQAIEAHLAIASLIQADRQNKYVLASAVRIRLAGNLRKTKPVYETYIEERDALVKRLGTANKEGNLEVSLTSPNRAEFDEELKKMNNEPTEIEKFSSVTEDELFGVKPSSAEKENKQNQVDIDILTSLIEFGILKE